MAGRETRQWCPHSHRSTGWGRDAVAGMMTFTIGFAVQQHAWSGMVSGESGAQVLPSSAGETGPVVGAAWRPPPPRRGNLRLM